MRLSILASLISMAASGGAVAKKTVECNAPDGSTTQVGVPEVRKGQAELKKALQKSGVYMLDLALEAQEAATAFDEAARTNDWCAAAEQLAILAPHIHGARAHPELVDDKYARLERWVKGAEWPQGTRIKGERILANAQAKIARGGHAEANKLLNGLIELLFKTKGPWQLPAELPEMKTDLAGATRAQLKEADIEEGCPKLAKKGSSSPAELRDVLKRLRGVMNKRKVRVTDLDDGPEMLHDLTSYVQLKAFWPATRVLCAMHGRLSRLEIDLGFAMARFHLVNQLSRDQTREGEAAARFKELVRSASAAIADAKFEDAHRDLEALLVLLGQPDPPGAALPVLSE